MKRNVTTLLQDKHLPHKTFLHIMAKFSTGNAA